MRTTIKIASSLVIALGLIHTYIALFCRYMDSNALWFFGAGFAIIFAGLVNFMALDGGGSRFRTGAALGANALLLGMFCYAIPILNNSQVYIGIVLFLVTT